MRHRQFCHRRYELAFSKFSQIAHEQVFGFSHHHRIANRVWRWKRSIASITYRRIPRKNLWNPDWICWIRWCDHRISDWKQRRGEKVKRKTLTHKNRPNACNRFGLIFLNSNDRGHEATDCPLLIDVSAFRFVRWVHGLCPAFCAPCKYAGQTEKIYQEFGDVLCLNALC